MIYNQLVTWTAFVILAMFILYPIPPLAPPFSVFIPSVGAAIVDNRGEVRRLGSFPNAHSAQVEVTTCQRGHYDDHDNSDSNNDFKNDCVQQTKSTITTTDNIFFWFSDSHVVSP